MRLYLVVFLGLSMIAPTVSAQSNPTAGPIFGAARCAAYLDALAQSMVAYEPAGARRAKSLSANLMNLALDLKAAYGASALTKEGVIARRMSEIYSDSFGEMERILYFSDPQAFDTGLADDLVRANAASIRANELVTGCLLVVRANRLDR